MATVESVPVGGRVILGDIDWPTYLLLREKQINRNVRMTYDRGRLELMCPSKRHERLGYLLGRFIDDWTDAFDIPVQACRCTTFQRESEYRGLEPDNCYYLEHEAQVRDRDEIDLACDPPPDLAIEIDVTSSSATRLDLYASLRVPEVWRWKNERIEIRRLDRRSRYQLCNESRALPGFPVADAASILDEKWGSDDGQIVKAFRKVIRSAKNTRRRN